jgi:hypothetical protein
VNEVPVVGEAVLGRVLAHRRDHDPVPKPDAADLERGEEMNRRFPLGGGGKGGCVHGRNLARKTNRGGLLSRPDHTSYPESRDHSIVLLSSAAA